MTRRPGSGKPFQRDGEHLAPSPASKGSGQGGAKPRRDQRPRPQEEPRLSIQTLPQRKALPLRLGILPGDFDDLALQFHEALEMSEVGGFVS